MASEKIIQVLFLANSLISVHLYKIDFDPLILKGKLDDLVVHSLKTKDMQAHLDKTAFEDVNAGGEDLLQELVENFAEEFRIREVVLKRLRAAVQIAYQPHNDGGQKQCCENDKPVAYEPRFRTRVSINYSCEIFRQTVVNKHHLTRFFDEVCRQNLKDVPSLKWQFFGSEYGVSSLFPGPKPPVCKEGDPRFKPWYVQASVPQAKAIVIVMDKSGSMSETHHGSKRIDLAKDVAGDIVDTLNPNDKVAVLAMSDKQETLSDYSKYGDCFRTTLAQATPQNKAEISKFINLLAPSGGSYYSKALEKAFDFFLSEYDSSIEADRVIHFISDDLPNESPEVILETLRLKNQQLNNTVKILTYGIRDIAEREESILEQISKENPKAIKKGQYIAVTDPSQVRSQLSSFLKSYFSGDEVTQPSWTVPYLDGLGLGQMMTASLPVYLKVELIGVVGVDLPLEDLLLKSTFFKPNEFTYSFVINQAGLIVNHPLFPYVDDNASLFVSAQAFERDPEFKEILESMRRGDNGTKLINSVKVSSRGDSKKYGVSSHKVRALYFWQRIPNTTFSVCVVSVGAMHKVLMPQGHLPSGEFIYHRFDLVPPKDPCNQLNTFGAKGSKYPLDPKTSPTFIAKITVPEKPFLSYFEVGLLEVRVRGIGGEKKKLLPQFSTKSTNNSIMLPSRTFNNPTYYFNHQFNAAEANQIKNFMEGKEENVHGIKDGIKDEVVATNQANILWNKADENTALQSHVFFRFLATMNGVYRIYPGIQLSRFYDPISRPWFEHAVSHRWLSSSITSPYPISGTNMGVISIGRVLFKGKADGAHDPLNDELFGVMGMDVQLVHFYNLFLKWYPDCQSNILHRCYLIDKAGYIIVTNNMNESFQDLNDFNERHSWEAHLSELEPEITNQLIRKNIFQRINCSNIEAGLFQRTYLIPDNQTSYSGTLTRFFFDIFTFKLIPVPETNTFLLIRLLSNSGCSFYTFSCPCVHAVNTKLTCTTDGNEENNCECPCASPNSHYIPCKNEYNLSSDSPPPCTPLKKTEVTHDEAAVYKVNETIKLPQCYYLSFSLKDEHHEDNQFIIVPSTISGVVVFLCVCFFIFSISTYNKRERRKRTLKHALVRCRHYRRAVVANVRKSFSTTPDTKISETEKKGANYLAKVEEIFPQKSKESSKIEFDKFNKNESLVFETNVLTGMQSSHEKLKPLQNENLQSIEEEEIDDLNLRRQSISIFDNVTQETSISPSSPSIQEHPGEEDSHRLSLQRELDNLNLGKGRKSLELPEHSNLSTGRRASLPEEHSDITVSDRSDSVLQFESDTNVTKVVQEDKSLSYTENEEGFNQNLSSNDRFMTDISKNNTSEWAYSENGVTLGSKLCIDLHKQSISNSQRLSMHPGHSEDNISLHSGNEEDSNQNSSLKDSIIADVSKKNTLESADSEKSVSLNTKLHIDFHKQSVSDSHRLSLHPGHSDLLDTNHDTNALKSKEPLIPATERTHSMPLVHSLHMQENLESNPSIESEPAVAEDWLLPEEQTDSSRSFDVDTSCEKKTVASKTNQANEKISDELQDVKSLSALKALDSGNQSPQSTQSFDVDCVIFVKEIKAASNSTDQNNSSTSSSATTKE